MSHDDDRGGITKPFRHTDLFRIFFLGGFECSTDRLRNGKRLDLLRATVACGVQLANGFRIGCALISLISASCSHPTTPTTVALSVTRFRPEPVGYLAFTGYADAATIVIRDREAWQSAWTRL